MKTTLRRRGKQSAFTLIEVLVSLGIFAIGSLGVLAMVTTSLNLNNNSRQIQEASLLAQWKLEQIQLITTTHAFIASCATGNGCWQDGTSATPGASAKCVRPTDVLGSGVGSTAFYQLNWQQTPLAGANLGMRYIRVTVFWPRNHQQMSTDYSSALDCRATPTSCRSVEFHVYK